MHLVGEALVEGTFPAVQTLDLESGWPYAQELAASLDRAPCRATLRRVELSIPEADLVCLPRLVHVLAGLPGLEHVRLWYWPPDAWEVEGGRDVLLRLSGVLAGVEGGDQQGLRSLIQTFVWLMRNL
jgi:hypothetical protein